MSNGVSFIIFICSVIVASFSQILLKKSALVKHNSIIQEYLNPYVIVGYGMLFGSMLATILAFNNLDYKFGPVIESLGFVLVIFLSFIFFKEKITKRKIAGTVLILVGILIFNI